jgi:hypothetical protein
VDKKMEIITVIDKVEKKIKRLSKGRILFADDFAGMGTPSTVNKALYRLKEKKLLVRLSQGVYLYPELKEIGVITPTIEDIAKAIAKRDKARIVPTGVYALNKLGLSTQIPMNVVFLTDGAARKIKIGKRSIKFKKTTPKNLLLKGEISSLVIQALRELGKDDLQLEQLEKLKKHLEKEKPENIKYNLNLAPDWIRKILLESLKKSQNEKLA